MQSKGLREGILSDNCTRSDASLYWISWRPCIFEALEKIYLCWQREDPPSRFEWDNGERIFPPGVIFYFRFGVSCVSWGKWCLVDQDKLSLQIKDRPLIEVRCGFLEIGWLSSIGWSFVFPATFSWRFLPGHTQNKLHAACPQPNKTASFCGIDIYLPPTSCFVGGCLLFVMRSITMS